MKILNANITGFFSYGATPTIQLDNCGLVLLEGLNGHGKSSLFQSIVAILYDETPTGENGDKLVNRLFKNGAFGKVEFIDDKDVRWRVLYLRRWKGQKYPAQEVYDEPSEWLESGNEYKGTDLYLERWEGKWIDARPTNEVGRAALDMRATRNYIVKILGMSYSQFMSVAYLAQEATLKFIQGKHKDRLDVLSELMLSSLWDQRSQMVKERLRKAQDAISHLSSYIDGLEKSHKIMQKPDPASKLNIQTDILKCQSALTKCDANIEIFNGKINDWLKNKNDLDIKGTELLAEVRNITRKKSELSQAAGKNTSKYSNTCNDIRNRPRDTRIDELDYLCREMRATIQSRKIDLEQMLSNEGKCPRCKSYVSIDHIVRQRELVLMELTELEDKIRQNTIEMDSLILMWNKSIEEDLENETKIYESEQGLYKAADIKYDEKLASIWQEMENIRVQLSQVGPNPQELLNAEMATRMNLLQQQQLISNRLRDWEESSKKWDEIGASITTARHSIHEQEKLAKNLSVVEKMMGDKGIKAFKLDSILDMLNQHLQKFLDILTEGQISVYVTQYRTKVDGNQTADIQIVVKDGLKEGIPFSLYSGGEKQIITLAFIGAFWQLASSQGTGTNLLCLDEIFGPLDQINSGKVVEYLDILKSYGKSSIFVVTHDQRVQDELNFDQKWYVKKTNHISTITTENV